MGRHALALAVLWGLSSTAPVWALDPMVPREARHSGMIGVKSPLPASDQVTLIQLSTGEQHTLAPGHLLQVPVGKYRVKVVMQDYQYEQEVLVEPTERTDVVVPGYGGLKVHSRAGEASVEVMQVGTEKPVAQFSALETKILPSGFYDVRIRVGKFTVKQDNVWVVSNTTRELELRPGPQPPPGSPAPKL